MTKKTMIRKKPAKSAEVTERLLNERGDQELKEFLEMPKSPLVSMAARAREIVNSRLVTLTALRSDAGAKNDVELTRVFALNNGLRKILAC